MSRTVGYKDSFFNQNLFYISTSFISTPETSQTGGRVRNDPSEQYSRSPNMEGHIAMLRMTNSIKFLKQSFFTQVQNQ